MSELGRRDLLQASILLYLRTGAVDEEDLISWLREPEAGANPPRATRRQLRAFERVGLVRSSWQAASYRPTHRRYWITTKGIVSLARRSDVIAAAHREVHEFLERYARVSNENLLPQNEKLLV